MLVVIATERAATRQTIEDEISEFLSTRHRASIVPVDFGGAVHKAQWLGLIQGIPIESEKHPSALNDGNPSPSVLSRIEEQFSYTRRNQRLRRAMVATAISLTLLILANITAAIYLTKQVSATKSANAEAEGAKRAATSAIKDKEEAERLTSIARAEENRAKVEAKEQRRVANSAAHQANLANEQAREAKAAADYQQAIADSRQLANRSQDALQLGVNSVTDSISFAVQALKRFPTVEADTALRHSLSMFPRRKRVAHYTGDILDAALSPDGQHLAILTSNNLLQVYKSGDQAPLLEFPCRDRQATSDDFRTRLVAMSNDAAHAVVVSAEDAIVVDLQKRRSHSIHLIGGELSITEIAMSPNGQYIALAYRRKEGFFIGAMVLNALTGEVKEDFRDDVSILVTKVKFSPNGDLILSGFPRRPAPILKVTAIDTDSVGLVAWRLPNKQDEGNTKSQEGHFQRVFEKRFRLPGFERRTFQDSLGIASNFSTIVSEKVIYRLNDNDEYSPVAYLPSANPETGRASNERQYSINNDQTQLIVLTADFPSYGAMWSKPIRSLEKSSRPSWNIEWWDLNNYPSVVSEFHGGSLPIYQLRFDSDNQAIRVMTGPSSPIRCVRRTDNDTSVAKVEPLQTLNSVLGFSPNFHFMVTTHSGTFSVVESCGLKPSSFPFVTDLRLVLGTPTITDNGRFLALAGFADEGRAQPAVDIYRLINNRYEQWRRIQLPHTPIAIVLSPNGRFLITAAAGRSPQLWNVMTRVELTFSGLARSSIRMMSFSPDGQFLVGIDNDRKPLGRIWRLEDQTQIATFNPHYSPESPLQMFFSPRGHLLLQIGPQGARLIEVKTGRELQIIESILFAQDVAFSADERYVAIPTKDQEVLVFQTYEAKRGLVARLLPNGPIHGLAISPDNRYIVIGSRIPVSNLTASPYDVIRLWPLQPEDLIKEATERLSTVSNSPH